MSESHLHFVGIHLSDMQISNHWVYARLCQFKTVITGAQLKAWYISADNLKASNFPQGYKFTLKTVYYFWGKDLVQVREPVN